MWLHENLPAVYLVVGISAACTVGIRVWSARRRAMALFALSTEQPTALSDAFAAEATALGIALPPIAYLDVVKPLCFTLIGRRASIVVSRGFIEGLDASQMRLVALHELLHIKHRDPIRGFAWHLTFAAFVLPAFGALEAWLAARRELRTNLAAADGHPQAYADLLRAKARGMRGLCAEPQPAAGRSRGLMRALFEPVLVVALLLALAASHAWFLEHLAYLTSHHC